MNDNTLSFIEWIKKPSLRQAKESARVMLEEAEKCTNADRLKVLYFLLFVAEGLTKVLSSFDLSAMHVDVKKQTEAAKVSLKEQYELFNLELAQDMQVWEALNADSPEAGDEIRTVRSSLDRLQAVIKRYATESDKKPLAQKQK